MKYYFMLLYYKNGVVMVNPKMFDSIEQAQQDAIKHYLLVENTAWMAKYIICSTGPNGVKQVAKGTPPHVGLKWSEGY